MGRTPGLSKSRFTAGLQCPRLLGWRVHEPDAPELQPDPQQRALLDQGTRVGELARTYVPGGRLIALPHDRFAEKLAATRDALASGAPAVYEASFDQDRIFVAVDILERVGSGFAVVEVKSSTCVKPEHLPDAAIQAHVLGRAGLEVRRVEIMHLNRACTFPDLGDLFVREDVTADVTALLPDLPRRAEEQLRMLAGALPEGSIGPHCTDPRTCEFVGRCWAGLPEHHVTTLYFAGKKAWALEAAGYRTVPEVPEELLPHVAAGRQWRSLRGGGRIVEPTLAQAMARVCGPLAFLDFETIMPAIPVWNGCHPYDQVPVQFSCHVQDGAHGWTHHEWLADGPSDPRPAIAGRVVEACAGARTVLAYNASFERRCLRGLAEATGGALADGLAGVEARLADLLPLVRDHVYDPAFGGSFSLKDVLPALVPDLSYEDLEVAEGGAAMVELERLLLRGDGLPPVAKERLRKALLEYCALDTWGTVKLFEALQGMAR